LVAVIPLKTSRPVQTGQGMIKDGSWEDASFCRFIRHSHTNTAL
jgi:hypothetical protein